MNEEDKIYYVPDIILVGYGRNQIAMNQCIKCNERFIPIEYDDLFCEMCNDPYTNHDYITEEHKSNVFIRGDIIDWAIEIPFGPKRKTLNYKKVMKRDNYICQYCGYNPRFDRELINLTIDHIIPHVAGGNNGLKNLVVACQQCNSIAGAKWFDTYIDKKIYILDRREEKGYERRLKYEQQTQDLQGH